MPTSRARFICALFVRVSCALILASCAGRSPGNELTTNDAAVVRAVADELEDQFLEASRDTAAWTSVTDAQVERTAEQNRRWVAQLERVRPAALIGTSDWALHANLLERSRNQLAQRVCRFELWNLSTFGGWHLAMAEIARAGRFDTDSGRTRNLSRFRALPAHVEREMTRLRRGAEAGYTAPAPVVRAVIGQLEALVPRDPLTSPLDAPATRAAELASEWRAVVRDSVYPAVARFRAFLQNEYLPRARPDGSLSTQRDGAACYRALLRTIAGRDVDPAAVMADARLFLDSLLRELGPSARRFAGTDNTFEAIRLLRSDPRFTIADRDTLLGMYRAAMERARAAMPAFFSHVTQVPVVVEPHGPAQERAGFPAQYSAAPFDGSRPARVFVNLARNDRMNVGLAVAHEGFPGHHQERAMQAELPRPHPVIRRLGNAGYTEGWGLYSEWLADTMGIYAGELERVGYQIHLSDAALGAILDVGYHVYGWSREALVDSMMATGGRSRQLAEAYADRHAATPSQIATYHIGYRDITTARARARDVLGSRFDLREFHTAVLDEGTMPLPALAQKIERWTTQAGPAAQAVEELLAADRAFAASATDMITTFGAMFADSVWLASQGRLAATRGEALDALRANPANAGARAEWTPIRGGVSGDGEHGFTFGYMTMTRADGTRVPLKYLSYWVRTANGWRVAAFKRRPRPDGPVSLALMPPSLPQVNSAPGPVADTTRLGLQRAEQAFSDEAQRIGLGPAFARHGWPDAVNMGGPNDTAWVMGAANIGRGIGSDTTGSPVAWSADRVMVASSGDLGITFGTIRPNGQAGQPGVPFFTIWRRLGGRGPWRYIAE